MVGGRGAGDADDGVWTLDGAGRRQDDFVIGGRSGGPKNEGSRRFQHIFLCSSCTIIIIVVIRFVTTAQARLLYTILLYRNTHTALMSSKDEEGALNNGEALYLTAPPRTYIAGEDAGRLARAARQLGLEEARTPANSLRQLFSDSLAARMHSVGALGEDERVDDTGTLHYITVRRRRPAPSTTYGTLGDLFHKKPAVQVQEEEEAEEEETIIEDVVEGGSLNAAIFGLIKGTVGPAILYLPQGFQGSGYAVAIPAMLFATGMYIYNAYRLLECWSVESERNYKIAQRIKQVRTLLQPHDNDDVDYTSKLLTYPELAHRALGPYAFVVQLGIASMQFGVCLTYLIFVPQNLQEATRALFSRTIPKSYFLVAMLAIVLPLSWITDIRKLTPTNVAATFLIAYGLVAILIMAFFQGLAIDDATGEPVFRENLASLPAWTDSWFLFIGTSFFMMEGSITLLVPLQEAVFLDQDRAKFPSVNQTVTSWIVVFYILFSITCVAAFGDGLRTALTASLPPGMFSTTIQIAYSIAVILTFPLQAFPAMEVACKALLPKRHDKHAMRRRTFLATALTLLLGVIAAVAIDYLGNVVSILGSLFGIPLALVFPPLMHNSLVGDKKVMNYCVVCVGIFAMGAASFATMVSWNKGAE